MRFLALALGELPDFALRVMAGSVDMATRATARLFDREGVGRDPGIELVRRAGVEPRADEGVFGLHRAGLAAPGTGGTLHRDPTQPFALYRCRKMYRL